MKKPHQLALPLAHRARIGREDFVAGSANAEALARIDAWPLWPEGVLLLVGPPGAGKSHLAAIWSVKAGALAEEGASLGALAVPALLRTGALVVEDADAIPDEVTLFHLLNFARETEAALLLTSRKRPAAWGVRLPDLATRLVALPSVELSMPDDSLLAALLAKHLADRRLVVAPEVVPYLAPRIERSYAAVAAVVEALDQASLALRRPVTVPLAGDVLARLETQAFNRNDARLV